MVVDVVLPAVLGLVHVGESSIDTYIIVCGLDPMFRISRDNDHGNSHRIASIIGRMCSKERVRVKRGYAYQLEK